MCGGGGGWAPRGDYMGCIEQCLWQEMTETVIILTRISINVLVYVDVPISYFLLQCMAFKANQ